MAVNPIKIITNLCLYLVALLPVSLGTLGIFAIKAIPIYLATLLEFWETLDIVAALTWYKNVLLCPPRQLHKGNPRAMTVGRDQL